MEEQIREVCTELAEWLIEKNRAYGNSIADPVRIFSRVNTIEQINIRIDDKLSRLMRGQEYPGDDTEKDLLGYLILKRVVKRFEKESGGAPYVCRTEKNQTHKARYAAQNAAKEAISWAGANSATRGGAPKPEEIQSEGKTQIQLPPNIPKAKPRLEQPIEDWVKDNY